MTLMTNHECAPVVRLLSESPREAERLIEQYLTSNSDFKPPEYITVTIEHQNQIVTAIRTAWRWDYAVAEQMSRRIGLGLAINLSTRLSQLAKRLNIGLKPSTAKGVSKTFSNLLNSIPELSNYLIIIEQ